MGISTSNNQEHFGVMTGVREHSEGVPVSLDRDLRTGRLSIVALGDGGRIETSVDLLDIAAWLNSDRGRLLLAQEEGSLPASVDSGLVADPLYALAVVMQGLDDDGSLMINTVVEVTRAFDDAVAEAMIVADVQEALDDGWSLVPPVAVARISPALARAYVKDLDTYGA